MFAGTVVCQWCKRVNTRTKPRWAEWSIWVEIPYLRQSPKLVCIGCAFEIYHACASREYDVHMDRVWVQELAEHERMTERDFRLACLRHQVMVMLLNTPVDDMDKDEREWFDRCRDIIRTLEAEAT